MVNDSVGALHIAYSRGGRLVGILYFSLPGSLEKTECQRKSSKFWWYPVRRTIPMYRGARRGLVNRELTRRAGVILGTDFFVVRAHARTTPISSKVTPSIGRQARHL